MTAEPYIFLAGASRGVGREIAQCLIDQNLKVKALLRKESDRAPLEAMGIKIVAGDALDAAALERAMLADEPIRAVISTMGSLPNDPEKVDYLGNKNLIDAALKAGVQKFILISSIGSGNSVVSMPPQALQTLAPILVEKEKAEQYLIDSGLTYIIIRPGGLKSEPATGNGILTEDYRVVGSIHRADVAQLVCRCLVSDKANNKVFSAVDRNMTYGQSEFEEFTTH